MGFIFLPVTSKDLAKRGWKDLDIILISGDAYVDHPSYGPAVIGRVLERAGYRVGIIPQPDWRQVEPFTRLGKPRLFFGITAGNLDSMVANYTTHKKPRKQDDYSPGGKAGLRPDRATIVYANRVREAYGSVPIVIGGIEASLRRFAHYDWWDNGVRRSILLDSRADILVYGMGERQVIEIADRMSTGKEISGIPGTAIVRTTIEDLSDTVRIPSSEEVTENKEKFNEAFKTIYLNQDPFRGKTIVQPHGNRFVVQFPPPHPMDREELDATYTLPFTRSWHKTYDHAGGIPGHETVRFSVISHRGCCGECSFCSLSMHQGRIIQSRSKESIMKEVRSIVERPDFKGTITDVGGPTANLYGAHCSRWKGEGACEKRSCLVPKVCSNLKLGYRPTMALYDEILGTAGIKHVFVESGLRYDLLVDGKTDSFLKHLCRFHVSGRLKVAPEHNADKVLRIMNKPAWKTYETFEKRFEEANSAAGKKQYLVNYFISAHPGSTLDDALELALHLIRKGSHPEQIQDYLPLPLTLSSTIYYTEKHPFTGEPVYVPKTFTERKMQRALIQYRNAGSMQLIRAALKELHKEHLLPIFLRAARETGRKTV